ncbi:hypothetical protein PROFUN_01207 [Planoprotostelium fungivorum]|uniref:Uncharacterized protein n=1 Tax=Planoprotostelium fungivorum TaxID=1890364 RepID=A0A2P6NCM6_9EUKA|nr:hypothetical protein PROFUN_01207 [Planoprotostelium fungivorum]
MESPQITFRQQGQPDIETKIRSWEIISVVWIISALCHFIYMVASLTIGNEPVMLEGRTDDVYLMGQLITALVILMILLKSPSLLSGVGVVTKFRVEIVEAAPKVTLLHLE